MSTDNVMSLFSGSAIGIISSTVATAGFYAASGFFSRLIAAWRARSASEDMAFALAFESGELELVGDYLREYLGAVPVKTFLDDEEARTRLTRCLSSLSSEVNQQPPAETAPHHVDVKRAHHTKGREATKRPPKDAHSDAITTAKDWVTDGKVWDAMTFLRRQVERAIVDKSPAALIPLEPKSFQHPSMRGALGAFLSVANRAIHGLDVSQEDAERAIAAAEFILKSLNDRHFADLSSSLSDRPNQSAN